MSFTPLHRALGLPPSPLTDKILDAAVDAGVVETHDLDWKAELTPIKNLSQSDVPKDIAAMANGGGGMLVYGVEGHEKAAASRVNVELTEGYERAYRSVAVTAISPPVFGLQIECLGSNPRAVVVNIPASIDSPHLVYKNDLFGAPIRNDADTAWMRERQIEAMYRARFEERRHATETLDVLYEEAAAGRDSRTRAWLIAVAHPRIPRFRERLTREQVRKLLASAASLALTHAGRGGIHPFENVDRDNPRPGLRRWVAVNTAIGERSVWREAWMSIQHDGSVTVAAAVGGHRQSSNDYFEGWEVESSAIECAIADLMALMRTTAEATGNDEYDVRLGIEWAGSEPLTILTKDTMGFTYDGVSVPLHRYTPVETSVNAAASASDFSWRIYEFAQDCVNQGGISHLQMIQPPED